MTDSPDKDAIPDLVDGFYPPNKPLCAKYKLGFGYTTINHRLPVILTKVIDHMAREKNVIGEKFGEGALNEVKEVIGALALLKNEMVTNKSITPTGCQVWNDYLTHVAKSEFDGNENSVRWYVAPWLFVECYMYHRMNEAFRNTQLLKGYDPFRVQKEEAWFECLQPASVLYQYINLKIKGEALVQTLLEVSLWGNRCDLSISQGEANSQTSTNLVDQLVGLRHNIIANDSVQVWNTLKRSQSSHLQPRRLGYILDNSAFELFTDLCFAEALLDNNLTEHVDFYVKTEPWFISDVLVQDFHWMLNAMAESDDAVLHQLAEKWRGNLQSGKFSVKEHKFWTYPHAYHEMKKAEPGLYAELQSKSFLIFKGDLNYRKLIADTNWDFDTPFAKSLQGFLPAPLVALRTLKADCVSGLPSGVGEELSRVNHDWMNTGEYGLIQFAV